MTADVRPAWMRWLDPHRRPSLVALSIVWWCIALANFVAIVTVYGPWVGVMSNAWTMTAASLFVGWCFAQRRLHAPRRARAG